MHATIALVLCILAGLAALTSFVKPYTKEKWFFLGVAAVLTLLTVSSPDLDAAAVKAKVQKAEEETVSAQPKGFPLYYAKLKGQAAVPPGAEITEPPVLDPNQVLATPYVTKSGAKSLYRRQIELKPLGRIHLPPPSTPGVRVLTDFSAHGPELRYIPNRQPLGILDPAPNQQIPQDDNSSGK